MISDRAKNYEIIAYYIIVLKCVDKFLRHSFEQQNKK